MVNPVLERSIKQMKCSLFLLLYFDLHLIHTIDTAHIDGLSLEPSPPAPIWRRRLLYAPGGSLWRFSGTAAGNSSWLPSILELGETAWRRTNLIMQETLHPI